MKRLRITVNGVSYEVEVEVLEDDGDAARMPAALPAAQLDLGAPRRAAAPPAQDPPATGGAGVITSPIAGIIAEVRVGIGDTVKEHDPLVVIEAMKMNTNVSSPMAGKIQAIHVKVGESVRQGQPLLEFA